MKCKIYPNRNTRKDGACKYWELCKHAGGPECVATSSYSGMPIRAEKVKQKGGMCMDKALRDKLLVKEIDEDKVVKLLKQGKTVWEVTEEVFGTKFDHSDRETWVFYSRVNRIRRKHGIPAAKKKKESKEKNEQ